MEDDAVVEAVLRELEEVRDCLGASVSKSSSSIGPLFVTSVAFVTGGSYSMSRSLRMPDLPRAGDPGHSSRYLDQEHDPWNEGSSEARPGTDEVRIVPLHAPHPFPSAGFDAHASCHIGITVGFGVFVGVLLGNGFEPRAPVVDGVAAASILVVFAGMCWGSRNSSASSAAPSLKRSPTI